MASECHSLSKPCLGKRTWNAWGSYEALLISKPKRVAKEGAIDICKGKSILE